MGATQYLILRSPLGFAGGALASPLPRTGTSLIPQIGQLPGWSWITCGCMPQV